MQVAPKSTSLLLASHHQTLARMLQVDVQSQRVQRGGGLSSEVLQEPSIRRAERFGPTASAEHQLTYRFTAMHER